MLVKRVMQDGRVVSGLDKSSPNNTGNEDLEIDEDQGTLASNGEPPLNRD